MLQKSDMQNMSRTADYTIQGFIYQFIVTLQKILLTDSNSEITIEGPIEDIDISTPTGIEAIQCKYHETKDKFTLSSIYKPVLQMMSYYYKNPSKNIKYKLYAHFPNETVGSKRVLTSSDINQILSSKDKGFESLIFELAGFKDISGFISKFELEFGASLVDLEKAVIVALSGEGFSTEDSEEIFYPNSIHRIAQISTNHNSDSRKVKKFEFISELKEKKRTAITRWTRELNSYEKLLKKRRDQMRENLNKNSRIRAIILDADFITDFDTKAVQLIEDFINKYNTKIKLHQCPIVCLKCDEEKLNSIWKRLNSKKISVERGYIAGQFDIKHFLREPMKMVKDSKSEFRLRLCLYSEFELVIKETNIDDIFIISENNIDFLKTIEDCNIETIESKEINEIKYLLSLSTNL